MVITSFSSVLYILNLIQMPADLFEFVDYKFRPFIHRSRQELTNVRYLAKRFPFPHQQDNRYANSHNNSINLQSV